MEEITEWTQSVIKESIKNVICIDDEFLPPYSENAGRDNIAKELYESFSNEYDCMIDVMKYEDPFNSLKKLENKDLLILDWELNQSEPKYGDALKILEQTVKSDIPFICVYTQEPDLEKIYSAIWGYFSGYNQDDLTKLREDIYYFELDEIIEKYKIQIFDCIYTQDNNAQGKVLGKIHGELSKEKKKELGSKNIKIDCEFLEKVYLEKNNVLLPKHILDVSKPKKMRSEGKTTALNLNGKILVVMKKKKTEEENDFAVGPSALLNKFSENIAKEPNNIFNVVWIQYKNYFNKIIYKPAGFFQDVQEDAFLYHYDKLYEEGKLYGDEKNVFDNFLRNLYKDEIISKLNTENFRTDETVMKYINKYKEEKEPKPEDKELVKLNYYYSINKEISNSSRNIQFGDMFEYSRDGREKEFFICVTAHCDCLRNQKIHNNYFFVRGSKFNNKKALINCEEDGQQYSFVKYGDDYISIEWHNGLFTMYISENKICSEGIYAFYKNKKISIKYICSLKENYAQRIANWAFSHANRIGITYAKITEKESTEKEDLTQSQVAASKDM